MKKLLKIFLLMQIIILSSAIVSYAEDNAVYDVYGLLSASGVMSYDKSFDFKDKVSAESYDDIMKFYFGKSFLSDKAPVNADAVADISYFAPKLSSGKNKISSYRDFGFIKKEQRKAYSIMCNAGYLTASDGMLRPDAPLSYSYLFSILKNFEAFARSNNGLEIHSGTVSDVYADKDNIVIKLSTDEGSKEYSFNRTHSFLVCDDLELAPYSYNIKRGQTAKIYTLEGSVIYASIVSDKQKLDKYEELGEAFIYICNEFDNELIFKSKLDGAYIKLPFDENIMIYEGTKKHPVSEINNTLLDRNCYYISDTLSGKIKYINITG